jgi:hypothetical protein
MVAYIRSDLDFILAQIKIAEAHAACVVNPFDPDAAPLYGSAWAASGFRPPALSLGLRAVDGRDNNLLPGQEQWELRTCSFPNCSTHWARRKRAGNFLPPGSDAVPTSYTPSNNPGSMVFGPSLRTISNLIVDRRSTQLRS